MNKEYKELLLQYLSMALPYNIIIRHADYLLDDEGNETSKFWYSHGYLCDVCSLDDMTTTIIESDGSDNEGYEHICVLERSLPYLRDMKDMTDEEKEEWRKSTCVVWDNGSDTTPDFARRTYSNYLGIAWLLKNHFDFMGLIEKGLAIRITKENKSI